ncbi:MAG: type IV secretory system conjugative DNA transfer family protein [Gammaproteobacteria bacterium]|nr:type IV secretory system conjugative DNA transfer family protein [Gammaproteobacteria bacterium]
MVMDDLPRGSPDRKTGTDTTPNAEWMGAPELLSDEYRFSPDKIFLGHIDGQLLGVGDDRHVMLCAGSRAGKGRSIIVPNLIEYQGSVLAIDPKAELASITAKRRAEGLGQRVFVLDPFGKASPEVDAYRASFNPLTMLYKGSPTIIEDAGLIADALIVPSGGDSHWDDSARNFLEGVILHVATSSEYPEEKRHLVTVRDLVSGRFQQTRGKGSLDFLQKEMEHNAKQCEALDEDLAAALEACSSDFFDKPDNERGSVLSTLRKHTKFLDYKAMREVLSEHSFDLSELKTAPNGTTIYLCLPAGRMSTCNRWFRLFVNLAIEALEREASKPDIPVLLCLDEFAVLGHMQQIEVAAGQIAGFGVKLMTVIQDLSQLKAIYKDRWETFMGNAGILIFFGNNDVTTLEFIQKRLGKTTVTVSRKSDVTAKTITQGGSGASWSNESHDLITIEEASRIFGRSDEHKRQLIIHAGKKPIIMKRLHYDTHPYFEGKFSKG